MLNQPSPMSSNSISPKNSMPASPGVALIDPMSFHPLTPKENCCPRLHLNSICYINQFSCKWVIDYFCFIAGIGSSAYRCWRVVQSLIPGNADENSEIPRAFPRCGPADQRQVPQ